MIYVFQYIMEVAAGVAVGIAIYGIGQLIADHIIDKIRGFK